MKSLVLTIIFGAAISTFAQNNLDVKSLSPAKTPAHFGVAKINSNPLQYDFPAPDTTALEKWYTVVKYEYYIFKEKLYFLVKPKAESRPLTFKATFYDADGVALGENFVVALSADTPVG